MEFNNFTKIYPQILLILFLLYITYIILKKNGIKGVLYLTRAPKFVPAIPTPKEKNIEKMKQ